jgi:1,2-diacylglycerol 3-beta-galactosyltransferase
VVLSERAVYPWVRSHIVGPLLENAGDIVISVHPVQTGIALRMLRDAGSRVPFVTMVTDPVAPPLAWLCPDVDLCLVATEHARTVAEGAGMPAERLRVVGLPVRRSFTAAGAIPKEAARCRLGLLPGLPLILLAGGGAGIGRLLDLARVLMVELCASRIDAQLAILTGSNDALRRRLEAEAWPLPVYALGYLADPASWFGAADLLLTKAGPSTLCEAGSVGLPMILTGFIPGQEAPNVTWVEEAGAGIYAPEPSRAATIAAQWLRGGAPILDAIGAQARALVEPGASAEVARLTLALLGERAASNRPAASGIQESGAQPF